MIETEDKEHLAEKWIGSSDIAKKSREDFIKDLTEFENKIKQTERK